MSEPRKTAIVTGASQGIGAGIVKGFVERGFNVVANSRKVTQSTEIAACDRVAPLLRRGWCGRSCGRGSRLARRGTGRLCARLRRRESGKQSCHRQRVRHAQGLALDGTGSDHDKGLA